MRRLYNHTIHFLCQCSHGVLPFKIKVTWSFLNKHFRLLSLFCIAYYVRCCGYWKTFCSFCSVACITVQFAVLVSLNMSRQSRSLITIKKCGQYIIPLLYSRSGVAHFRIPCDWATRKKSLAYSGPSDIIFHSAIVLQDSIVPPILWAME
jgi:hypothetical protein